MEAQHMAEVVPLFGDVDYPDHHPRVEVEIRTREWSHADRMRLARILIGDLVAGAGFGDELEAA